MQLWRKKPVSSWNVASLCEAVGVECPLVGRELALEGVLPLDEAGANHLSFLDNPKYKDMAGATRAGAVFIRPELVSLLPQGVIPLVTLAPYVAFARALQCFYPVEKAGFIHPSAVVEEGAFVAETARILAGAYVGEGVEIGANTVIGANCTVIKASIGKDCLLHAGVCIGQDGFGFAQAKGELIKVPQVGGVVIGDGVEMGAGCTVDCGALGDTVIGNHVKLDNQVQVGHNVKIGDFTRVVAQTGIAGSTQIGAWCVIGGQSAIAGHLVIADKVQVAARSGVTKSITQPGAIVAGLPAEPILDWRRKMALLARMVKKAKGGLSHE